MKKPWEFWNCELDYFENGIIIVFMPNTAQVPDCISETYLKLNKNACDI